MLQRYVEENHPELVPPQGFISGCDVCNLYYRNGELREEIKGQFDYDLGLEERL